MLIRKLSPKIALFFTVAAGFAVGSSAPLLIACGSSTPSATTAAAGQCPPGAAPGYPGCPPPGAPGTYPPGTYPPPTATAPGTYPPGTYPPPTATAPATAPPTAPPATAPPVAGDPTDLAIKAAGMQWAPGMQPEGARSNVQVIEGKDNSISVQLQGGKCYAIVAVGATGGVLGLDIQVMLPFITAPAASDTSAVGVAVAGKGANAICPLTPLPVPYTVRVIARRGSGTVGVQVFSKIK
jgi:hypothetical protein